MQKLYAMVLNSLADRVFTAARVRLMLESLARQAKESGKEQQRQLETLNRELAAVTLGMERLYEGVEQGVLKLDDTLRQRTDQLQAQRQAILTTSPGSRPRPRCPHTSCSRSTSTRSPGWYAQSSQRLSPRAALAFEWIAPAAGWLLPPARSLLRAAGDEPRGEGRHRKYPGSHPRSALRLRNRVSQRPTSDDYLLRPKIPGCRGPGTTRGACRYFTAAILSRIPGAQDFASSEARYTFCA